MTSASCSAWLVPVSMTLDNSPKQPGGRCECGSTTRTFTSGYAAATRGTISTAGFSRRSPKSALNDRPGHAIYGTSKRRGDILAVAGGMTSRLNCPIR